MATLNDISDVEIDPSGNFKYILIQVSDGHNSKIIVRGHNLYYHADIYDDEMAAKPQNLEYKCLGGGRIKHSPVDKTIEIYGYSVGFGAANHQITCELIKKKYTDYKVTWIKDKV